MTDEKRELLVLLRERNRRKRASLTLKKEKLWNRIEWSCEGQIVKEEAQELMRKSGYPPEGYGFWGLRYITNKTEWQSSNKC